MNSLTSSQLASRITSMTLSGMKQFFADSDINVSWRIAQENGYDRVLTGDFNSERLNLVLMDDLIVRVWLG